MQTALRVYQRFGAINAQYQLNKSRNAVRFEAQNIIWDYDEAHYQTQAFAKGLASLHFQPGNSPHTQAITSSSEYLPPSRPRPTLPSSAPPPWGPT